MDGTIFNGSCSLRTSDNCRKGKLLENFKFDSSKALQSKVIHKKGRSIVAIIDNVLTLEQCNEIIKKSERNGFDSMIDKYMQSQRTNSRQLLLDKDLALDLWDVLKVCINELMFKNEMSCQPLGFDVRKGEWNLDGLNEAFRVNKYTAKGKEFFAPHKDAQYCPNGDKRSLFTLLIYLNDDFAKGETSFYFPNKTDCSSLQTKGMTTQEEIESAGGLENGFEKFKIKPVVGRIVVFSQNILHESVPVQISTKYTLKTDIVVKRTKKFYGFSISPEEKDDYLKCLNYFRDAQVQELIENKKQAGDLYERALSIRYCYPAVIEEKEDNSQEKLTDNCQFFTFPDIVWHCIFDKISGRDIESVVQAFPDLWFTQKTWELRRCVKDENTYKGNPPYIPKVELQRGMYTCFRFPDSFFFSENEQGCVRVAAMYSFYLLGHKPDDKFYTVKYNQDTQEVTAVALKSLLFDAFLERPCYGAIYAVNQKDDKVKDPVADFQDSVDRNYMSLRHGAQFVGNALNEEMKVSVNWPTVKEKDVKSLVEDLILDNKLVNDEDSSSDDQHEIDDDDDDDDDDDEKDGEDEDNDDDDDDDDDDDMFKEEILNSIRHRLETADDPVDDFVWGYDTNFETFSGFPSVIQEVIRFQNVNASAFLYQNDDSGWYESWWKKEGNVTTTEEFQYEGSSAKQLFGNATIGICSAKPGVSVALVSSLKEKISGVGHMCFCYWPGGDGYKEIVDSCDTKIYNHLVFDFSSHQMIITKEGKLKIDKESIEKGEALDDEENCLFHDSCEVFAKQELGGLTNICRYRVNIAPLLEQAQPFNHASCNCYVPLFEITEYKNLLDYPMLDHIHVISGVKSETNEVFLWTVYGGIAAL